MKNWIVLLMLCVPFWFVTPIVHADESESSNPCDSTWKSKVYNNCSPHTVDTNTENGDEAGGGADVVLWQNDTPDPLIEEVVAEYRYDNRSQNHKVYGVVRVNLWNKIKGFFNKG